MPAGSPLQRGEGSSQNWSQLNELYEGGSSSSRGVKQRSGEVDSAEGREDYRVKAKGTSLKRGRAGASLVGSVACPPATRGQPRLVRHDRDERKSYPKRGREGGKLFTRLGLLVSVHDHRGVNETKKSGGNFCS